MVCALRNREETPLIRNEDVFISDRGGGVDIDRCTCSTARFESADHCSHGIVSMQLVFWCAREICCYFHLLIEL